jgi:tripartite-type tricarboxylate transporter receptor subunit TctC
MIAIRAAEIAMVAATALFATFVAFGNITDYDTNLAFVQHGKLNKEINAALADPKIKARLADLGGTVLAASPAEFGKLIADETEKWGKVIRAANIKAE